MLRREAELLRLLMVHGVDPERRLPDPYNLERFVAVQQELLDAVTDELAQGRKRTHWMWFVFPQFAGLGRSAMSQRYAINSLDEARAYAEHAELGPRLVQCVAVACGSPARSALELFGEPDDLKFHSCLTLFVAAAPDPEPYESALKRFFDGKPDAATLRLMETEPHAV